MGLIDVFYPKICVGCSRQGEYICQDCQRKLRKPEDICPQCCKPSLDGRVHARCRYKYGMDGLVVGLPYRGMVQQCLKKVKYKSAWDIVKFLFDLSNFELSSDYIVTSVPMWRKKERERGFNQAKILAQIVAKQLDFEEIDLLERVRSTRPMFGLKKPDRLANVDGAFRLIKKPANQRIILVDDVWTTGATMRECAKILKHGGAKVVWGLALAR